MIDRELFRWVVQLHDGETGETTDTDFRSYWSPDSFEVMERVKQAAAATARARSAPLMQPKKSIVALNAALLTE